MIATVFPFLVALIVFFILGGATVEAGFEWYELIKLSSYMMALGMLGFLAVGLLEVVAVIAFILLFIWLGEVISKWKSKSSKSDTSHLTTYKKPGLVSSYLKAKKDKVCPLIKFED